MHLMSFDVDCAEWTCRTEVLAGAAADAALDIHHRYMQLFAVGSGAVLYHQYGSCGTVTSTIAALDAVGQGYAVGFYPYGMSYLR